MTHDEETTLLMELETKDAEIASLRAELWQVNRELAALRERAEKAEAEVEVLREGIALARAHLILAWKRAGDLDGARAKISHAQLVLDSAMLGKPKEEALAGKGE